MILRGTVFVGLGEWLGFAGHSEGVAQPMVVFSLAPIQSSIQRSTGSYEVEMGLGVGGVYSRPDTGFDLLQL